MIFQKNPGGLYTVKQTGEHVSRLVQSVFFSYVVLSKRNYLSLPLI